MKRSFPANIDGQIFYIDEDAFELLNNYLTQLKNTFPGEEGKEIVTDIESRIREHFEVKAGSNSQLINIEDVTDVINVMGRPEQISDSPAGSAESSATPPPIDEEPTTAQDEESMPRKLYRNLQNKVFGGVFGGLAVYLNWNANVMRALYIILALSTHVWPCFIVYLIAWMIIPAARTPRERLRMHGRAVTVDGVGETVKADAGMCDSPGNNSSDFVSNLFTIMGKVVMGFVGIFSGTVAFGCIIGSIGLIVAGFTFLVAGIADGFMGEFVPFPFHMTGLWLGAIFCCLLLVGVLFGWLAWLCAAVVLNLSTGSRTARTTLLVILVTLMLAIAVLAVVGMMTI